MSNKRIGCENFGKFYTEGKVRNRREWRGVVDTLYDYSRWLHNWATVAKMVSKPRNIKTMFRYRWMANYLAVPMMVDRHTQGLRGEHLRICHLEQDLIIEDVAKLLDGLFRGDRRIGNDKAFSDKVVLVDENEMTAVMMGFPTRKGLVTEDTPENREQAYYDMAWLTENMIMRNRTHGGYKVLLDELWEYCTEFKADMVVLWEHMSCKALDGMHGMFEERAREYGIHLVWVSHDLFDPRVISRQGVRDQINNYMRTVMGEEPVDPSLEVLHDEESW